MKLSIKKMVLTGITSLIGTNLVSANNNYYDINSRTVPLQARTHPLFNQEKQPLHYSFALPSTIWKQPEYKAIEMQSDQYWAQVTGADFKRGITVNTSAPEAIVRFSVQQPQLLQRGYQSSQAAANINPDQLVIYKNNQPLNNAVQYAITQPVLAKSSVFNDSSVIQLDQSAGAGQFTLKSSQALGNNDRYVINIKERKSQKILELSAPRLAMRAGEAFFFNAALKDNATQSYDGKNNLLHTHYQFELYSPSGKHYAVQPQGSGTGGWQINLPDQLEASKPGELYELYIHAQAEERGIKIKRDAKLAFAIAQPTAQITAITPLFSQNIAASVTIKVKSAGRYGLRGTLYGQDQQGQSRAIMRSHSAYWLEPGEHTIFLYFDTTLLSKSGLKPPFQLREFQMIDQSQLKVLHLQAMVER